MKLSALERERTPRGARTRRALRIGAAVVALLGGLAGTAQLVPQAALAKPGSTSGSTSSSGSSGTGSGSSGSKSGGGGIVSKAKGAICGAVNSNPISGAIAGALNACSSSNGTTDPVQATSSVLKAVFAGGAVVVGAGATELIHSLTKVPDYSKSSAGLNRLEREMTAIAFALLGLVLTLSIMRFWLAGLSSGAGAAGVEGVTRTLAAALLIIAWPYLFHSLVGLMNAITHVVLNTFGAAASVDRLHLATALGATAVLAFFFGKTKIGWFFGIVLLGFATLVVLGLLLMKAALGDATIVIFVAAPLAFALWPLTETSWISGRVLSVLLAAVATPLIWAIIFATAGVFEASVSDGLFALPLRLLTAVSMFFLALLAPFLLLRQAHGGIRHPAGALTRIGSYVAGRTVSQAIGQHIHPSLGGQKGLSGPQLQESRDLGGGVVEAKAYRGPAAEARKAELAATGDAAELAVAAASGESEVDRGLTGAPVDSRRTDPYARAEQDGAATNKQDGTAGAAASEAVIGGAALSARRPEEPSSNFGFTNPGKLGIEDSGHVNRAMTAARDQDPSLGKASAAMGAFAPEAQQRIADTYSSQGPEGLRKTMAATAQFSDQITNGQAQALTVISGESDQNLAGLFQPGESATLSSDSPGGQAKPTPIHAQEGRTPASAPPVPTSGGTTAVQAPPVPTDGQTPPTQPGEK